MKKIINTILDLDPESKARLKKLEGKTVNIVIEPFQFPFHCTVKNNAMLIATGEVADAETTIRGTPLQLMGVMLFDQPGGFAEPARKITLTEPP